MPKLSVAVASAAAAFSHRVQIDSQPFRSINIRTDNLGASFWIHNRAERVWAILHHRPCFTSFAHTHFVLFRVLIILYCVQYVCTLFHQMIWRLGVRRSSKLKKEMEKRIIYANDIFYNIFNDIHLISNKSIYLSLISIKDKKWNTCNNLEV